MRIAVLQSSYDQSESEFKSFDNVDCNPAQYLPNDQVDNFLIDKATSGQVIQQLAQSGKYDVFINLCDGAAEEDRAGPDVVQALELANVPYSGAGVEYYSMDKQAMKTRMKEAGVSAPSFQFCFDMTTVQEADRTMKYPLLVKHFNGGGSLGMSKMSRVVNTADLMTETKRLISKYGGCLIEEFIEGREFTVLVAENMDNPDEPFAFVPVECRFEQGETFKHFDIKWGDPDAIRWIPIMDDPELVERLKRESKKTFKAVGGNSYGRCDIRMNANKEVFILEINANCGLFYQTQKEFGCADYILHYDPIGFKGFVKLLIANAIEAHAKKNHK